MIFPKIFAAATALLAAGTLFSATTEDASRRQTRDEDVRISSETLLRARQDYGETRVGRSVDGAPLNIAGKRFSFGVGTHATSMIPLDVPAGTVAFSGAVGIDDEAAAQPSDGAEFRILTGTRTLWTSGTMTRGVPAKTFSVKIPAGVSKIYLLTLAGENNWNDHADWVNLTWRRSRENSSAESAGAEKKRAAHGDRIFFGEAFGIEPDENADSGEAFRNAVSALRRNGGGTLELKKGTYHFFADKAHEMSFWVSNHDQSETLKIALPFVDLKNAEIRGNGSRFVFHGECVPVLFMDSENVSLEGVSIDFARPFSSEAKVVAFEGGKTVVSVDAEAFPYEIRDGKIFFLGENYPPQDIQVALAFRSEERGGGIVANTSDIACGNAAVALPDGNVRLSRDFSGVGDGVSVGDVLVLRNYRRPAPACVVYRAKNTTLRDVAFHSAFGMAVLAQRSENITITGTRDAESKTSGVFPSDGRVSSTVADATHFSNVKGKVVVENSFFEGMMDDAINVHSTCLDILEIIGSDTLKCRYRHPQAIGFELFLPGEKLRFIAGKTLENGAVAEVKSARRVSPTEALIQLRGKIPAGTAVGDAVENADFQPEVVFRGNVVRNNRARGALFTTPKKTLVENNAFRGVAGSAILLAGDAQGWYESGACEDVVIRGNVFENNLTSRFQFTNAIISIYPEVRALAEQKKFYHRNIRISDNEFRTFDVPLLFAISAEKISFENNRIFMNEAFRGWGQKPFQFKRCVDVSIRGNAVAPVGSGKLSPQKWTLGDCRLEMTAPEEIRFGK